MVSCFTGFLEVHNSLHSKHSNSCLVQSAIMDLPVPRVCQITKNYLGQDERIKGNVCF